MFSSVNYLFFLYSSDNQYAHLRDSTLFLIFSQVSNCQPDFGKYFQGLLYERSSHFLAACLLQVCSAEWQNQRQKLLWERTVISKIKGKTCLLSWSKTFTWFFALVFLFSHFTIKILLAHFLIYPMSALL